MLMKDEKTKIKQEQLIEMVSSFCDDKLDDEYRQLSINLIEKMGRKHDVPFKRGKLEIWASAVIYALGQINFLFDKSFEPYSTADEICDYFGTKKSTVSNKARVIREMFDLNHFDKEFSTEHVISGTPTYLIDEDSGMIVPASDADEFFDDVSYLFEEGKIDEALSKLDAVDENSPEYGRALFYKAMILGASGDEDTADDLLNQALSAEFGEDFSGIPDDDMDYDDPDELFAAGLFWYNMDDNVEALQFFDASLKIRPNDAETLYYKSLSLANLNEFKKALEVIDKAIKIDSNDDRFWNDKGNFLTRLNHISKAEKCFNKALKLNPTDSIIWANKGFMYLENEKFDKSFECYEKACELSPGEIHPIIGKVNVCIARDDFDLAQEYLDEASKIDDHDLEYLTAVAQLAMNKKDFKKSIEYWDKCIEIDDENPMFWVYKAFIYGFQDQTEKFEKCINKACEMDPSVVYLLEDFIEDEDI